MSVLELAPAAAEPAPWQATVGAEEEHLLVAGRAHRLVPACPQLIARLPRDAALGHATMELCDQSIELVSPVCDSAAGAAAALARLRRQVAAAGGTLLGAGVHPAGGFMERTFTQRERYQTIGDRLAGLVRTPTCGLHVHVGMPDPETMIRVFNGLRTELPLLLALSANSPYWHGADSGLASARAAILRSYPRSGVPRALADLEAFMRLEASLRAVGVEDYTQFWWDLRPHPRLGTVEVRIMDTQSSVEANAALIALVHGLATAVVVEGAVRELPHEAIEECASRAARYGADAQLAGPAGTLEPVEALARDAIRRARAHLHDDRPLEGIDRLLAEGGGAGRQRAAFARGGMGCVLRTLVAETAGS